MADFRALRTWEPKQSRNRVNSCPSGCRKHILAKFPTFSSDLFHLLSGSLPLGDNISASTWSLELRSRRAPHEPQDVLAICGGNMPAWVGQLVFDCKFLFPFDLRRRYFYCFSSGLARALQHLQQQQAAEGHTTTAQDRQELRVSRIQRQKVNLQISSPLSITLHCSKEEITPPPPSHTSIFGFPPLEGSTPSSNLTPRRAPPPSPPQLSFVRESAAGTIACTMALLQLP